MILSPMKIGEGVFLRAYSARYDLGRARQVTLNRRIADSTKELQRVLAPAE